MEIRNDVDAAVFEYLENGGKLPSDADRNPQQRFKFMSAMLRGVYQEASKARKESQEAIQEANQAKQTAESTKDAVNVRLGVVGGLIILAEAGAIVYRVLLP